MASVTSAIDKSIVNNDNVEKMRGTILFSLVNSAIKRLYGD